MVNQEAEKASREALMGKIKEGDSVKVSCRPYRGFYGVVGSVTDAGKVDVALVKLIHGGDVQVPLKDLVKKWPGLNPGDTPVGGWEKLLHEQDSRHPRPAVGQTVRNKENGEFGIVAIHLPGGRVGYEVLFATAAHPRQPRTRTEWALPSDLNVQTYSEGHIEHWSEYACDVKAQAATPILDLPEPYCRIRKVIKADRDWEAQDEVGSPIGLLGETEAHNLSIQLFWEFGI